MPLSNIETLLSYKNDVFIQEVYRLVLNRKKTENETYWEEQLEKGASKITVLKDILNSPEVQSKPHFSIANEMFQRYLQKIALSNQPANSTKKKGAYFRKFFSRPHSKKKLLNTLMALQQDCKVYREESNQQLQQFNKQLHTKEVVPTSTLTTITNNLSRIEEKQTDLLNLLQPNRSPSETLSFVFHQTLQQCIEEN